jgi:AcrR family transcriptional regulator
VRNYYRILDAAREVLGESGADASMEEIAARAGVGVGTVYRRFASKDALIDELLQLAHEEVLSATERALLHTDAMSCCTPSASRSHPTRATRACCCSVPPMPPLRAASGPPSRS